MKTFRIILSVLAIVVATGGAVASVRFTPPQKFMYDFIDNPGTDDDLCQEVLALCEVSGNIPCTVFQSQDSFDKMLA